MFFRTNPLAGLFLTLALSLLAAATPIALDARANNNNYNNQDCDDVPPPPPSSPPPPPPPAPEYTCNKGSMQCCNSVQSAKSVDFQQILSDDLLSILPTGLGSTNTPVGVTCSPIGDLAGGGECNQQTVCCNNDSFNGLIAVGCTPINIGA